jgi:hypothetical protein
MKTTGKVNQNRIFDGTLRKEKWELEKELSAEKS